MKKKIWTLIFCTLLLPGAFAQTGVQSVTLNQCIDSALIYNPFIKESVNETIISGLAVKTARSGLYPVISADFSGGYSNQYKLGNDYRSGNGTVSVDQVLWQNGKVKSSIDQARYNQNAADLSLEARKQDIILSVKTNYFNCLLQNQLYQIAIENVSKANLFLDYANERYKVGAGRKSDVLKAESDLAEAQFERDTYMNSLAQVQNELGMLTGFSPNQLSTLENRWSNDQLIKYGQFADSLSAIAFHNYPELLAINNLQLSQQAKIREVNAELYPRLGFNGGYNCSYNPVLSQQKGWYSALTLRWQIFNGNELRNRIQIEKTRKTIYENQEEEIKTFLIKEIRNRIISVNSAESQIRLTDRLMNTTSENLEIAKAQYKSGTGSMLELTDARMVDRLAKQKNIQAITSYQIALANLERLTGNMNKK
jgi:outer membrane protein TolC